MRAAYEAKILSAEDFRARRRAWLDGWRARSDDRAWRDGGYYLSLATFMPYVIDELSRGEALEAIAQLSTIDHVPPSFAIPDIGWNAAVGSILLAAGRVDEAITYLGRATRPCSLEVHLQIRPSLLLGRAYGAKGDRDHACQAYATVLGWWGKAKPRSVTAEKARVESSRLGCAPIP